MGKSSELIKHILEAAKKVKISNIEEEQEIIKQQLEAEIIEIITDAGRECYSVDITIANGVAEIRPACFPPLSMPGEES